MDGVLKELGCVVKSQFFFDARAVGFYGLDAQMELAGDFGHRIALPDQAEGFQFTIAQMASLT
jgi:hypothetical protein